MNSTELGALATPTAAGERPLTRMGRLVLVVVGGGVAVVAVGGVLRAPGYHPWLPTEWSLAVVLAPGAALLLAGLRHPGPEARHPQTAAVLLQSAGILWLMAAWNDPAADPWTFAAGRFAGWVYPLVAIHAAMLCQGRPRGGQVGGLAAAYLCAGVFGGLASVLLNDPSQTECRGCPADPLLVAHAPMMAGTAGQLAGWGGLAWSATLLVAQLAELRRSSPAGRRRRLPIAGAGIALCLITWLGYVEALRSTSPGPVDPAGGGVSLAFAVGLLAVACATVWPSVESRLIRIRLAKLVADSAGAADRTGGLIAALRSLLGDPTARLLYPVPGGQLVDPDGVSSGSLPTPDRHMLPIRRGTATVAYLNRQRTQLDLDGAILDDIACTTRLLLDGERLRAEHSWHLRELRESRRRIVAAADAARRSLERDLHDGAQQHLVSVAMALTLAQLRTSSPLEVRLLREAGIEVSYALAELREIAHGIFPRELGDEGLDAALALLAESAASPVAVAGALNSRLPAGVESAAYFAVRASLAAQLDGTAGAATVGVRLLPTDPDLGSAAWLIVDIETDAAPSGLLAIEDRLGALGGRLAVRSQAASTNLRVELPCAW